MSIQSQTDKTGPFLISGSPQTIPVGFPFQQGSDLLVLDTGPTSAPHDPALVLVLGSDFTVSGGGYLTPYSTPNQMQTGSIVVVTGGTNNVQTNDNIVILRNVPINQTTSYAATGPLTVALIEQALDKSATISQELEENISRCLQFENWEFVNGVLIKSSRVNSLLGFDANGNIEYFPQTITGGSSPFSVSTIAALKALSVAGVSTGTQASVAGYYTAFDGGGGLFVYNGSSSSADNAGTIIAPSVGSGRWLRIYLNEISAAGFGASGTQTAAVNTLAIQNMVAVINANLGGIMSFTTDTTYNVLAVKSSTLFAFTSLTGLTIKGNGAIINDTQTYSGTDVATLFTFTACNNIFIELEVTTQAYTVDKVGLTSFQFLQGCLNVNLDVTIYGGIFAVYFLKQYADPAYYSSSNITAKISASHCEYGCLCGRSGNNANIQIDCNTVGRNIFFYGVHDIHAQVNSFNQSGATEIAAYGGNGCQDIWLDFTDNTSNTQVTSNESIIIQYSDQTPAVMRNIHINLNTLNPAASPRANTIDILKLNNSGNPDTVGRGHVLDGLYITGYDMQVNTVDHIGYSGTFVTPDVQTNINLSGLTLASTGTSGVNLQLGALVGYASIENVYCPGGPVTALNGANGVVAFYNVYATYFSPAANTSGTDVHEYFGCNSTASGSASFINKALYNTYVNGVLYGAQSYGRSFVPGGTSGNFAAAGGMLYQSITPVVSQANTNEHALITHTVLGGTLVTNGDRLRYRGILVYASNATTKDIRIYFGGTAIYDSTALAINGGSMFFDIIITRLTATTQNCYGTIISSNATQPSISVFTTASETLSGNSIAEVSSQQGVGAAGSDVIQKESFIELLPVSSQ